ALFINDDPEFRDRGRLDVNFENADNKLEGLRFYGEHSYELISERDSLGHSVLTLGNSISFEEKSFKYGQDAPFSGFGPSYETANLFSATYLDDFNVKGYADFDNSLLGKATVW